MPFRHDRDLLSHLTRSQGLAPVSADQALTLSQQSGCALYVETSARACNRSAMSAFEVAFLVASGRLGPQNDPSPPPAVPPKTEDRMGSLPPPPAVPPKPRRAVSQMALNNKENYYSPEPAVAMTARAGNRSVTAMNAFSGEWEIFI